jgi:hypothetical protein
MEEMPQWARTAVLVLLSAWILASAGPAFAVKSGHLDRWHATYDSSCVERDGVEPDPELTQPTCPSGPQVRWTYECYSFTALLAVGVIAFLIGFLFALILTSRPRDRVIIIRDRVIIIFQERIAEATRHGLSTCAGLLPEAEARVLKAIDDA